MALNLDRTVFITFDVDWACDEVIEDSLGLIENGDARATFFLTHSSAVFDKHLNSTSIELGAHPNFNGLLDGNSTVEGMRQVVKNIREIAPSAVSVRSHSLTQNTKLLDIFHEYGFTHDVNLLIPAQSGMILRPFVNWGGLIRAPYFWEEDIHCIFQSEGKEVGWDVGKFLEIPGLKIFNFHPIHVFLNTERLTRYDECRPYHKDVNELIGHKNGNPLEGTRFFLNSLIAEVKRREMSFGLIREITVNG